MAQKKEKRSSRSANDIILKEITIMANKNYKNSLIKDLFKNIIDLVVNSIKVVFYKAFKKA